MPSKAASERILMRSVMAFLQLFERRARVVRPQSRELMTNDSLRQSIIDPPKNAIQQSVVREYSPGPWLLYRHPEGVRRMLAGG